MQNSTQLLANLAQFTGTTQWFKHPLFSKFRYTDGVRYLAINAECYWLLEFIFGHQSNAKIRNTPFQVWKIVKKEEQTQFVNRSRVGEHKATITIEDGNDTLIKTFSIPFTTFPLAEYSLWMIEGVLLLKSEY